jgi:tetratricopeptide (TPR) repeat protein
VPGRRGPLPSAHDDDLPRPARARQGSRRLRTLRVPCDEAVRPVALGGTHDSQPGACSAPRCWYVPLWRGTLALLAGRWEEAGELADRALNLGLQADDPNGPLFVGIQRALGVYAQRRVGELDRVRLVEGTVASPAAAEWLVYLALLDAETGAIENARRRVSELARDGCSALAMDANWHAACILADAAVHVGDREGAALYALLEPHAALFPVIARAVACLGSAEYYVGRLADLLGRHDEAEARLRRAVAENDRAGAAPHAVTALLRLGETLTHRGERESAGDVLRHAAPRADVLAMPALAAEAERLRAPTVR